MTFNEFKAWLDGFSEAIEGAPTPEQWAKVREKMAQVYEPIPVLSPPVILPTTYPVLPRDMTNPWWTSPITCGSSQTTAAGEYKVRN